MPSSIGSMIWRKRGERKPAMPSAIPPMTPNGTAMMMEESVSMALSHWPKAAR